MPTAVQFWGKDNVVQAYEYAGMPSWAIFCQRNIMTSYDGDSLVEGAQSLEQFFEMLMPSHSDGLYQLRMYKQPKGDIVNSTPYNASFNFKLHEQDDLDARMGGLGHSWKALNDRLDRIEQRLTEDEGGQEEEPDGWQAAIGAILKKPEMQNMIVEKIFGLVGRVFGTKPVAAPGATMGAAPDGTVTSAELYAALPQDQRDKLDAAMPILMLNDPQVGDNLLKIASILANDPAKYRTFAAML